MATQITIVIALLLSIIIPFGTFLYGKKTKGGFKAAIAFNAFFFFSTIVIANVLMFKGYAFAATTTTSATTTADGIKYLAAALATGLSCIGGGIATGAAASAAIGAISEDSSILGKSLIFVALAEGIALYGLIVSFTILSK